MNECFSWEECISNNYVNFVAPDCWKAKSLSQTAHSRIHFIDAVSINTDNADFVFENYYLALLELLHAFLLLKGIKIENHVCVGFYIRDVLKEEKQFFEFNDFRQKRNRLIYYGKRMQLETALDAIEKCKKLISNIKNSLEHESRQN